MSTNKTNHGRHAAILLTILLALPAITLFARGSNEAIPAEGTDIRALEAQADRLSRAAADRRGPAFRELQSRLDGPMGRLNADPDISLVDLDGKGRPVFYAVENLISAQSVGTDRLWPGGSSGLDLVGANPLGEIVVWDAGVARASHQEYGGRVIIGDSGADLHYHSAHVVGTVAASGFDPDARGMSPGATVRSRDWYDDEYEVASDAAAGMLLSNHSYGTIVGWRWSSSAEAYYWYGDVALDPNEDHGFGFYGAATRELDEITHNAPYYLYCKSAGNDRNDYGPDEGEGHYYWDDGAWDWVWTTETRPGDDQDGGYDTIGNRGNAKNILTVGAVNDVVGGWSHPDSVRMSTFSNWGPTDDGRIKPDLVANGVGLYSTLEDADDSYGSFSGTSMSSPSACGSLHLVAQHYKTTHGGQTMRAATLKAVAIHTCDEAGDAPGPDYSFGWGLLNTERAALLVDDDASVQHRITESTLSQGGTQSWLLWSDGVEPLVATLCWTDPPGPESVYAVDPTDLRLVNDLDLEIEQVDGGAIHSPWVLDPANPSLAATTGDNDRDNVEQVEIAAPAAGWYLVRVGSEGSLQGGSQDFGLVTSGLAAGPANTAPAVANLSFAQRTDGSGLVDIRFDLDDAEGDPLTVSLEASFDGGASWDQPITMTSGDVGTGVAIGTGKLVVWDFAGEHPGRFLEAAMIRVTADDGR